MGFIILLLLTTLSIAGSAAFFSVFGLARVFSGAFWSIVFMGSSLEAGKLVAASFLYRYWIKLSRAMRVYLFSAVIALMAITSMGIFGYLSSAFQDNVLPYQQQQQQIALLQDDKAQAEKLKTERLAREDQINQQIANLPNNFVNGRNRLMRANKEELVQIRKDVADYTKQILDDTNKISALKGQVLQETAHVGPIIFIADAFGADVNQATKWLIILIIFVFDPLAVILTVGANMAIAEYKNNKVVKLPPPLIKSDPPREPVAAPVSSPATVSPKPTVDDVVDSASNLRKVMDLYNKPETELTKEELSAKRTFNYTFDRHLELLRGTKNKG